MQQDIKIIQDTKIIQAFNLVDLLKEVKELVLQGYDFDFNTIEHFPQQFGLHFHVPMLKGGVKQSDSTPGAALQSTIPDGAALQPDTQDSSENSVVQEERTEDSDEQAPEAPKRGRKKGV